jgi:predicted ATPase
VEAVLAARIDTLAPDERTVIEPAAVIGRQFAAPAIDAVLQAELSVSEVMPGIVERQMVSTLRDPDALVDHRFPNLMLRVIYEGLLKSQRWPLHLRYADWLVGLPALQGRIAAFDEVLGHHLEQAYLLGHQTAPADEMQEVGRRAVGHLSAAGSRAFERGDMPAAANLIGRAASLVPDGDPRKPLLALAAGEARVETGSSRRPRRGSPRRRRQVLRRVGGNGGRRRAGHGGAELPERWRCHRCRE